MTSGKIVIAYRFDDFIPKINSTVHCFKTLKDLQDFVKPQGKQFTSVRLWQIKGIVTRDEGGPDGWVIKVENYKEIPKDLY